MTFSFPHPPMPRLRRARSSVRRAAAAHFPLIASEYQHPDVAGQSVLILLPLLRDRTHLEVAPGSPVSLRKA